MKLLTLLTILLLLVQSTEEQQAQNFYLENQSIKYKKVFEMNELNQSVIVEKLNTYLPTVSGLTNIQFNGNVFTGQINILTVNYRRYGGKWATTWGALNHPMNANITIQVKDNKYRLVITDIKFISTSPYCVIHINKSATKKKGTKITKNKLVLKGLEYIDKFFTEKFTITEKQINENW